MYNVDTIKGASFSLSNRLARLLWNFVYILLFRFTPAPLHEWRSFLLRMFGAKVGKNVHVYPGVKIWAPWNLDLKDQCGVASGVTLYSQDKITIGHRTVISQGAHLCTGSHNYKLPGFPLFTKPIFIENNVWVASEAFIHPGIKVGEGCVIGARSVVTENMPAWMICSGHPCRPMKKRNLETNKKEFQVLTETAI